MEPQVTKSAGTPIPRTDDLRGLKIRVMATPVLVETFNALGAQATPMSFGELYSGLEQGVVDGAETDHVDLLYERFYEVTKYVSYTRHLYLASSLTFSRKVYDRLPEDIQQAVLRAGRESVLAQRRAMETATENALARLQEVTSLEFSEVDVSLFRERVQTVYRNHSENVGGIEVINEILRF